MKSLVPEIDPEKATSTLYLPDGSLHRPGRDFRECIQEERCKQRITVTGAFPTCQDARVLIETIRDPENPERLVFMVWEGGKAAFVHHVERDGQIFVPPDPTSNSFPLLSLPNGLLPCGEPAVLLAEISSTISKFVKLRQEQSLVVASFVLTTWFPDCFEAAPYLWVVGPLGSGKTKLLKLLSCLCRRGLIAGDLRSGSLYKLTDAWAPTLIIDELEPGRSGASAELLRVLRTGSSPGVPVFRNGQAFSTYGLKIVALRQPLGDAALMSRGVVVSLLPTEEDTLPLDRPAMQQIQMEYQPKLSMFRLTNHAAVKHFRLPSNALQDLSTRMRQIARALAAPLLGDAERVSKLLAILGEHDEEIRIERSLEPEWLVGEAVFCVCHDGVENDRLVSEILVGGVAARVNEMLKIRGEDFRLGAKKAGLVLKSLGVPTVRMGRMGRGLRLTFSLRRKVHEIAQHLGIDRRTMATLPGLESGYGGARCALCEQFGLTAGLKFVETRKLPPRGFRPSQRVRLFDAPDFEGNRELVREPDEFES